MALFLCFGDAAAAAGGAGGTIGVWKNYTSMRDVRAAALTGDTLWVATGGGAFRYIIADTLYTLFANTEGLSSNDLTAVEVDPDGDVWFGSSTGAIDVYSPRDRSWRRILDISLSSQPMKGVRSFLSTGDTILIGTDFGMSIFIRSRWEFKDTYLKIGPLPAQVPVTTIALIRDTVWVGTLQGLAMAPFHRPLNSPSSWTGFRQSDGLPSNAVQDISDSPFGVCVATSQGAAVLSGALWSGLVPSLQGVDVVRLVNSNEGLFAALRTGSVYLVSPARQAAPFAQNLPSAPTALLIDRAGSVFVGLQGNGISFYPAGQGARTILPNGPTSNLFTSLAVNANGTLWVATGFNGRGTGFFGFDGTKWNSYTVQQYPQLGTNDYYRAAVGAKGSMWFSSWGTGVAMLDSHGGLHVFTSANAGFVGIPDDPKFVVIGGVASDDRGNTWMTVRTAADGNAIAVFTPDSTWKFFRNGYNSSLTLLTKLVIDPYGTKWIISEDPQRPGLLYFNDRGTLDNQSDDIWGFLTTDDGLVSNSIRVIAVDRLGDIWVGTDLGLNHIVNPTNPTAQGAISPYVPLRGVLVSSIAVDALNNKWVSTPDGVVQLSSDGTDAVQYTSASTNGKLIGGTVGDIAVDASTGTVYIGTDQGLSTLTTIAVAPVASASSLVLSPNPFRVPSDGNVTIDGLAAESSVKILTSDGLVVNEFDTPGGRIALWDGRDENGNAVPTGVYFIIAYTRDGAQVAKGKLAVIRK